MTNWTAWQPQIRATLLFLVRDEMVLLIRKKRGLGAGKINGPGGKIDPGESARQSALRETSEEVGITVLDAAERGELHFQFVDGLSLHCAVFLAREFSGEPRETAEAIPIWFPLNSIPYDEMWADDRLWLPLLLAGRRFRGFFEFDGARLLDHRVERLSDESFSPNDSDSR